MPVVQYVEKNPKGRDFIVGDIHGAFRLLERTMDSVGFDVSRDRLLSVGDMINRGPESERCSEFMHHPWFYATRGNHEDFLFDLYAGGELVVPLLWEKSEAFGLKWISNTPSDLMKEIVAASRKLPIAIELETEYQKIGIVHADVPRAMNWRTFVRELEQGNSAAILTALQGRSRRQDRDESGVEGIDHVFVGHKPYPKGAQSLGNVHYIDTGAVFHELGEMPEGHLTMVNVSRPHFEFVTSKNLPNAQFRP